MSDPKQPGDLKPGFYYVRTAHHGDVGRWTVGELRAACKPYVVPTWITVDNGFVIAQSCNWFEVGAYLDPQPGELRSEVLSCVAYENKKKVDEG